MSSRATKQAARKLLARNEETEACLQGRVTNGAACQSVSLYKEMQARDPPVADTLHYNLQSFGPIKYGHPSLCTTVSATHQCSAKV